MNSVVFDEEKQLIVIEIREKIEKSLITKLAQEVAQLSKSHDCFLVLNDARESTMGLTTLEVFNLPGTIVDILSKTGVEVYKFKRALVVSEDVDDFTFFETVSKNRGQNVTLFRTIDEAITWLFEK